MALIVSAPPSNRRLFHPARKQRTIGLLQEEGIKRASTNRRPCCLHLARVRVNTQKIIGTVKATAQTGGGRSRSRPEETNVARSRSAAGTEKTKRRSLAEIEMLTMAMRISEPKENRTRKRSNADVRVELEMSRETIIPIRQTAVVAIHHHLRRMTTDNGPGDEHRCSRTSVHG